MARIPDEKRAEIARSLRATPGASIRSIALYHEVSPWTVSTIAREIGVEPAARAFTKNATEARRADMAAERAELSARLLAVARRALDDMESPATIYNFGGKDNTYNERQVSRPPVGDQRNLATIAAIALDKHRMLDQYDTTAAAGAAVDAWLDALQGGRDGA